MTGAAQKLGVSAPTLSEWRKGRLAGACRPKSAKKGAVLVPVRAGERLAGVEVTGV
ncbi:hypothetical protein SAMN05443639_103149 [Stigmatella erecta]|uniref:Uncharacterized protein n=1 Tax=Stigmatella erecta TaxID=83460 RepID=A0A1I0EV44_9BACT|nr:hypothetical protein SAMN05443639_103149 [Stigmatella erecta]